MMLSSAVTLVFLLGFANAAVLPEAEMAFNEEDAMLLERLEMSNDPADGAYLFPPFESPDSSHLEQLSAMMEEMERQIPTTPPPIPGMERQIPTTPPPIPGMDASSHTEPPIMPTEIEIRLAERIAYLQERQEETAPPEIMI